jgi:hypothetical protein
MIRVQEKGKIGHVPLGDLEVTPKTDKNYWLVREYVVWFAFHQGDESGFVAWKAGKRQG